MRTAREPTAPPNGRWTHRCCTFNKVRDALRRRRGEHVDHVVKRVVFGPACEHYEMDCGDGEGKEQLHEAIGWDAALELIKEDIARAIGDGDREDFFVHVDATPPCGGVSYFNSGKGFEERRSKGIELTKWTYELLLALKEQGVIDTATLENTRACLFEWHKE